MLAPGFTVTAVDPSRDMLAQSRLRLPAVQIQVGTGEATGLADDTADLVTFAQSWHWVESTGLTETARILKPGGKAGWVWNFVDVGVAWAVKLAEIWHTVGAEAVDAARHEPVLSAAYRSLDAATFEGRQCSHAD